jgi:hypothetical protein
MPLPPGMETGFTAQINVTSHSCHGRLGSCFCHHADRQHHACMESQSDEYSGLFAVQPMKMPGQLSLAMRNLLRHRARTAATLAAISIGVASLILAGGFVKDILCN